MVLEVPASSEVIYVEMNRKLLFYDRYGVEEYYQYEPESNYLNG